MIAGRRVLAKRPINCGNGSPCWRGGRQAGAFPARSGRIGRWRVRCPRRDRQVVRCCVEIWLLACDCSFTERVISSIPCCASSTALWACSTMRETSPPRRCLLPVPVSPCLMAASTCPDWAFSSAVTRVISLAYCAVFSASLRTSSATTAKPRPCSPARAASMAAFSASRLICSAMSFTCWVAPMMLWVLPRNFSTESAMPFTAVCTLDMARSRCLHRDPAPVGIVGAARGDFPDLFGVVGHRGNAGGHLFHGGGGGGDSASLIGAGAAQSGGGIGQVAGQAVQLLGVGLDAVDQGLQAGRRNG